MIERKTWVATFDGSEARVYGYDRQGRLHALPGEAMTGGHGPHAGEGRATAPDDPENLTEDGFVRKFAARLDDLARRGEFEHLVVAAAPRALGVFRKAVGPALEEAIRLELDKDHVNTPMKELERTLAERL